MTEQHPPKSGQQHLDIELTDEIAGGHYVNLAIIVHSPTEFVIDFIQVMPGMPKGKVRTRVILAPTHAKRVLAALQDNIRKYEETHGPIHEPGPTGYIVGGPTAEA